MAIPFIWRSPTQYGCSGPEHDLSLCCLFVLKGQRSSLCREQSRYTPSIDVGGLTRHENNLLESRNGTFAQLAVQSPQIYAPSVSFVELRFSFKDGNNNPLTLSRTDVTFYDFDASRSGNVRECIAALGASSTILPPQSTLEPINVRQLSAYTHPHPVELDELTRTRPYETALCGTDSGVGADNPTNPSTLTALERSRAVMYSFEQTNHFDVIFAVKREVPATQCCGPRNSRILLFSG